MRKVILDGAVCAEREAAMAALEEALDLPKHWGRNLDALHDCLWDCGEVLIAVRNRQVLESTSFGRTLWQVLNDSADEIPWLRVTTIRRLRVRPVGENPADPR